MRESPAWPRITLGGGVERSRATDAASSDAIGTLAEPLGLLSRVVHGAIARGAGHSAWPNAHYVIKAVGKFNAQRRHRIDPVRIVRRSSSGAPSAIKPPHDCSDHQHDDHDQNWGFEHGALSAWLARYSSVCAVTPRAFSNVAMAFSLSAFCSA